MNEVMVIWIGSAIGVLGGAVGTWCSIRNSGGPLERAFMVRVALLCWLTVTAFLVALWFTPSPYEVLLCLPEMAVLHVALLVGNRKLVQIRKLDQIRKEEGGRVDSY